MTKRHRWFFSAALAVALLGGAGGIWWLHRNLRVTPDSTVDSLIPEGDDAVSALGDREAPELTVVRDDRISETAKVAMPSHERKRLAAEGILTNADRPMDVLARDPAVIMMRNAIIDTALLSEGGRDVDIPEAFRAPPEFRQAIVVFNDPVSSRQRDWIESQGVRVEHFVPNRALAVSGPHDAIVRLSDDPAVRHIEPFHPFFKMDADIQAHLTGDPDAATRARATSGRYHVLLFGDPETVIRSVTGVGDAMLDLPLLDSPGTSPRRGALGIEGARVRELPVLSGQAVAEISSDPDTLKQLVLADAVKWIEPVPHFEVMNDLGRQTTGRERMRTVFPGLDGSGQIIGVVDTGADTNHPALAGRLVHYEVKAGATSDGLFGDATGHGTHVLGTILGSGALSDTVASAPGSEGPPHGPRQFAGMATNAQYVIIEDFNSFTHAEMAWEAYSRGARIANNSWGAATNFDYGISSMYWDALVRDVNWGLAGNQDYTVFFAAGNRGEGEKDGTGGIAGTISQPGNAKNVITIGAIEQKRDADNLPQEPYESRESTDTDWQVASFSGRGPVGLQDRRVKPDLVAPGEYVLSLQSAAINSQFIDAPIGEMRDFNAGNVDTGSRYAFMSGTSRSTAFASGAAALLRQHYFATHGMQPSPAMMKALLINGAQPLHQNAYEWGPKRDGSSLAVATVINAGTVSNQTGLIAWWRFGNDYIDEINGTNIYLDPALVPGYVTPPPAADFEGADNNPGFGSFVKYITGFTQFEMQESAISNLWHTTNQVRTIEFWIQREVSSSASLLEFSTPNPDSGRIRIESPNIISPEGTEMGTASVFVNGSTLLPVLKDGWNHVVVIPSSPITATNWVLGGLVADIDELRFYSSVLTPSMIEHNYTNGVGYYIAPSQVLTAQMNGLHREPIIYDGWGRLDLAGSILGAETFGGNHIVPFDENGLPPMTTGTDWQYTYPVTSAATNGSLKVTLVWTDVHGTPGTGPMLVNDLDLRVWYEPGTADETVYIGNFLGRQTWGLASYPIEISPTAEFESMDVEPGQYSVVEPLVLGDLRQLGSLHDRNNNVEQVIIRDLLPGNYMIEVIGHQVPVDGDPLDPGQRFAVVINRTVSSAGESMGAEPSLAVDTENTPVLAYTTTESGGGMLSDPRTQIAVRRWIDSHTNRLDRWNALENKWFHYGDGPYREIVSRSEVGSAFSPSITFDASNTLYLAWIQRNTAEDVPDAVYLRYLTDARQREAWNGTNRWQQLGVSYQGLGISGSNILENAESPTVKIAWDNQPVVAYRQGTRILAKKWSTNSLTWRGLDHSVTGLVATTAAADAPVEMAVDVYGHPVLVWPDTAVDRLRVVRWDGSQWRPVAGGVLGDATAIGVGIDCDDFGAIGVSWVSSDGGIPSVRAARTTVGGSAWRGLGYGAANSMAHPGICGATNSTVRRTRLAFTPRGNMMVSWLADDPEELSRQLLKKWDGVQWGGLAGSSLMPGIVDSLGPLDQSALVSDTNGFAIVGLRSVRTGSQEVRVFQSQQLDLGGTDPDDSTSPVPQVLSATNVFGIDAIYQFGDIVPISVQFASSVSVIGTPILEMNTLPSNRNAFYASNSAPDTLVFHYQVQAGDSAALLEYTGTDALRLNGGAFIVGTDWYFYAAAPNPGGVGSLSVNNAISVDGTAYTLTVASPWGPVDPPPGTHWYADSATVEPSVLMSPVAFGATTQFVAVGWAGSGSVPPDPTQNHPDVFFETQNTNTSFVIGGNSQLSWQWATNYWLETAVAGPGLVDVASGWRKRGVDVVITATDAGQPFGYWSGDTNGCTIVGNQITVPMDRARSITAVFNPHKLVIKSAYGDPTPAVGTNAYVHNTLVALSIQGSPAQIGATQWVAVGWAGVGSVPSSPLQSHPEVFYETQNTNLAFNITQYSELTWQWMPNVWLATDVVGPGTLDVASGWRKQGGEVTLTATADAGRAFFAWVGDVDDAEITGASITFNMDRARSVTAIFDRGLTVQSAHGTPLPAAGDYALAHGSGVAALMTDSPLTSGGTQVVAVGWTGSGSVPASPSADHPSAYYQTQHTNLSFSLTADSVLTWQWKTNVWLATEVAGGGTLDVASGWRKQASEATLTATADADRAFVAWAGDVDDAEITGSSITLSMDRARTVTAIFDRGLTVQSAHGTPLPAVGDHALAHGNGVAASLPDSPLTLDGTQVVAIGWTGSGSVPASPPADHPSVYYETQHTNVSFSLTDDSELTWQWATNVWLAADANGPGTLDVASGWFKRDAVVTLMATPDAGSQFLSWTGDLEGCTQDGASITVPMDRARNLTAVFDRSLTIVSAHGTPVPAAGGYALEYGTAVTASIPNSPLAAGGAQVVAVGWIGTGSVPAAPAVEHPADTYLTQHTNVAFTLETDSELIWQWATNLWLAADVAGPGTLDVASGWRKQGSEVTLTATADAGRSFVAWSGDIDGGDIDGVSITLIMDRPRSVTAIFDQALTVQSAHGTSVPAAGDYALAHGIEKTAAMLDSPLSVGGTQTVAIGWTATGSIPDAPPLAHPSDYYLTQHTNVTFNLTADSTLTWKWATNVWLATDVVGPGALDAASGWRKQGSEVTLTATADADRAFFAWAGDVDDAEITGASITLSMDRARSLTAIFDQALTVVSAHGTPDPASGSHALAHGSAVMASMPDSPLTVGGTQMVAVGWTGTGSVPATPDAVHPAEYYLTQHTNVAFTLEAESELTWQWAMNMWLAAGVDGEGTVTVSVDGGTPLELEGWVAQETTVEVSAQAAEGHQLAYWSINGVSNAVDLTEIVMTQAQSLIAHFQPVAATDPDPEPDHVYDLAVARGISVAWLDEHFEQTDEDVLDPDRDYDGDGYTLHQEYIAGTDPLDPQSFLRMSSVTADPAAGGMVLSWRAVEGRRYTVEFACCMGGEWMVLDQPSFNGESTMTVADPDAVPGARFYRIRVELDSTK